MPGQRTVIAGRYELTAPISRGGMGQVWHGYDTVLDRDIAVKLIRPEIVESADRAGFISRFRREARVTAKIEHPGVPTVYDAAFDETSDMLYIAMQLVHGVSLADLRHEHDGPLPLDWVVCIAAQICAVLSHAHAIPVIHRDLKPQNVMVDRAGTVKVLDFGIAAVLGTDVAQLTTTGQVLGTKPYMSPEQIKSTPVSPRSDLYSLGCLLHELLAGQRVFRATDELSLIYQHLHTSPTPVRELRPDVPASLEALILDLLEKEAVDRPANAWEVHDRLVPFLPAAAPGAPDYSRAPAALPDPTRPYRHPGAPLPRPRPPAGSDVADASTTIVRDEELDAAHSQAVELLEEERFSQAADLLAGILTAAAGSRPPTDPRLLDLRLTLAAARFYGGDFRQALPELDHLAEVLADVRGPQDEEAINCRRQAAFCHAELGDFDHALRDVLRLTAPVVGRYGPDSEPALAVRLEIARFQAAAGHATDAQVTLRGLHADAGRLLGRQHPVTQQAAGLLARLRPQPDI
ncbi:serine/threonine-protein kinase [Frankia sp. Mgl5]|uniref:serine/threonine-protein kinase n=1 Tax=Frankia sp. Mgl5 TaxID=2933793 RepID=UPI00200C531D|nr:serine/threonine-protein kinase [Frankia sp. Mgl5]MCK9926961.1 serine/threonine-protein kinase [Frankia sp. Mgl5]